MCGRYASGRDPADLAVLFGTVWDDAAEPRSSWNIAPTDTVSAVLERADGSKLDWARQLRPMRWGLVPSWAADARGAARMINARVETAAHKPAFRKAFVARRCLLPADGWYEWQPGHGRAKTPHFIRPRHGAVLAFAGLYELWHDPAPPREDAASWLWTTTILTTAALPELRHLHHRMPIVVDPARYDAWLDPVLRDPDAVRALLPPIRPDLLEAHPVDPAVGNVANNGPHLTRPRLPDAEPAQPVGQTTPDGG